ncbi:autoinducer binding domain-containing protein [Mesorhizobium sp. WSM2561]|uniref:autoinducer binding domain-containing protein n=1 Tax=Mesorhizobium sp. WSM2561 TaxID=1040985 RepID=UPI001FD9A1DB|nr:autoinducer binding domain-containing protein [Mesorhizobium sp. WSM2561]
MLTCPCRREPSGKPKLISNYPHRWTAHYLSNRNQQVDPVIARAQCGGCPFRWAWSGSFVERNGHWSGLSNRARSAAPAPP